MNWKLQIFALVLYLVVITGGFVFIPKENPMFGMGMIPGPLALIGGFGLPIISAIGIGVVVYRKSKVRKGINAAFFLVCSD